MEVIPSSAPPMVLKSPFSSVAALYHHLLPFLIVLVAYSNSAVSSLIPTMNVVWPSADGDNSAFWQHEVGKNRGPEGGERRE